MPQLATWDVGSCLVVKKRRVIGVRSWNYAFSKMKNKSECKNYERTKIISGQDRFRDAKECVDLGGWGAGIHSTVTRTKRFRVEYS